MLASRSMSISCSLPTRRRTSPNVRTKLHKLVRFSFLVASRKHLEKKNFRYIQKTPIKGSPATFDSIPRQLHSALEYPEKSVKLVESLHIMESSGKHQLISCYTCIELQQFYSRNLNHFNSFLSSTNMIFNRDEAEISKFITNELFLLLLSISPLQNLGAR